MSNRLKDAQAVISSLETTHFHSVNLFFFLTFFFISPAFMVPEWTAVWIQSVSQKEEWHFKGLLKMMRQEDMKKIPFYCQDHQRPFVASCSKSKKRVSGEVRIYQGTGKKGETREWECRVKKGKEKIWEAVKIFSSLLPFHSCIFNHVFSVDSWQPWKTSRHLLSMITMEFWLKLFGKWSHIHKCVWKEW